MPPLGDNVTATIQTYIDSNLVMIFSKSSCPFCTKVKELFNSLGVNFTSVELDEIDNGIAIQNGLEQKTGQRTVPNVFINGEHIGGCDDTLALHRDNKLSGKLQTTTYDYDLVVIGGGSGGLAASKEAARFGMKVACLDYVHPSPRGSTWGLGGTCVNVGCIPKKLMHQAAILGHNLADARKYGWELSEDVTHSWKKLRDAVQDHIGSLNWGYRVQLRDRNVTYMNSYGEFIDAHTLKTTNKRGKVKEITSSKFLIATGMRPRYPDVDGAAEYAISSDDLFSLPYAPGKTLVVGASYVSLECAGFLKTLGFDVTVMVRSILLRSFDQDMAERIGDHMIDDGIKFVRPAVPTKIERLQEGEPGLYKVTAKKQDGTEVVEEYNTIMFAVGRDPCTQNLGLNKVGVNVAKNGFIPVNDCEQTNVSHIYAVGDVCLDKPELTPVAIHAGRLLARRLFAAATEKTDYVNVPTTVFTPIEYGCIGLSEEDAISKYTADDIEVYHQHFWPLEHTIAKRPENECYAKLICVKSLDEKVVGLHVLGPNAGEITQGFALGFRLGAKKSDYDTIIGIHPTCAETFTTLSVTKSSGEDITTAGC